MINRFLASETDDVLDIVQGSEREDDEIDHSSSGGGSSTDNNSKNTNGSGRARNAQQQDMYSSKITGAETKRVFWSRAAFLSVLCVAAGATTAAVYILSHNDERKSFETRFDDFAHQIVEVSQINARDIFGVFESMSLQVTTYTDAANQTWPFVTIPGFEAQSRDVIETTGATRMGVVPIVKHADKEAYEKYQLEHQQWIQDDLDFAGSNATINTIPKLFTFDANGTLIFPNDSELYAPALAVAPIATSVGLINFESFSLPYFARVYEQMERTETAVLSEVINLGRDATYEYNWPQSFMTAPIFDKAIGPGTPNKHHEIVGIVSAQVPWHYYFLNLVPEGIDDIYLVIRNTCDQSFTFRIEGPDVIYLGVGELHETFLDHLEVSSGFTSFTSIDACTYSFHLYPSRQFRKTYKTSGPIINAAVVFCIFLLTAVFFIIYDQLVERRQSKVLTSATKSHAIVSSLFPDNVRDRIMDNNEAEKGEVEKPGKRLDAFRIVGGGHGTGRKSQTYGPAGQATTKQHLEQAKRSSPIADFFPSASVLFADIVGFTAWSSTREPTEVFMLLETVYNAFDRIAVRLKVFKVETIGDCYVAACGLPESRDDHAVVIFRFARQCLTKMGDLVHKLATVLGPDTADLSMRFGIHSGPVTAGVLRGEKSRFQLFGDTVNTAARMESNGAPNRVHLSQETANELSRHGKHHWYRPREDTIVAKGKGELQTFWGVLKGEASTDSPLMARGSDSVSELLEPAPLNRAGKKKQDLENHIKWTVKAMEQGLKKVLATRSTEQNPSSTSSTVSASSEEMQGWEQQHMFDGPIAQEAKDIISFPTEPRVYRSDPRSMKLDSTTRRELDKFVRTIACMYRDVAYHSFAHASHVVQSVQTKFARMSEQQQMSSWDSKSRPPTPTRTTASAGLTSDPLIQFACLFAALIHDVDHLGVPNATLIEQKHVIAATYNNKSVAEQNSLDVAWNLLMESTFTNLRACIYASRGEFFYFRQMVVNAVLATDIIDKESNQRRIKRWNIAFQALPPTPPPQPPSTPSSTSSESSLQLQVPLGGDMSATDHNNLRTTVAMEYLVQTCDVVHTMQHWQTYIKWNERLFQESYKSYQDGNTTEDPCRGWFQGEMKFFDNFVIPLAERLRDSCMLGASSSDEYLHYALANRKEWELRGREVLQGYLMMYIAARSDGGPAEY